MLKRFTATLVFAAIIALFCPFPSFGQTDETAIDPIKVTAQKREENVQEIPMSVDVINSRTIEEKGIRDFQELDRSVPNLVINTSGKGTYSYFGIRGRVNDTSDMDPTITVVVDGVAYNDFFTVTSLPLFDLERVEVLRGPQSTLYGMNSEAGVINIVTRKPGSEPRAWVGLTFGDGSSSNPSWSVRGSFSAPIVKDILAIGLAYSGINSGGYLHNIAENGGDAKSKENAIRLTTVLTPSNSFDATLNIAYSQVRANNGYIYLPATEEASKAIGLSGFEKYTINNDYLGYAKINNFSTDLTMRLKTGSVDLVSVTAWRRAHQHYYTDFDMGDPQGMGLPPGFGMAGTAENTVTTFLQELRVMSPQDRSSPLTWLFGAFYTSSQRDAMFKTGLNFTGQYELTPAMYNTLDMWDFAFFGQATYRVLDERLGFTIGARQEWTSRNLKDHLYLVGEKLEKKDSQFLPKFSIDYRITPDNLVYATVAMGWRPGGYYNFYFPSGGPALPKDELKYNKETSWTYELGSKNTFLDGRLKVNLAAFVSEYRDYLDVYSLSSMSQILKNAGRASIKGLELETEVEINEYISVHFDLGLLNAKYKTYHDDGGNDFSGKKISGVPNFTANAGLKISFLESFYISPEVRFKGRTYWDRANEYNEESFATLHLRAGYESNNWEVYLYGDNLTKEYAFNRGLIQSGNLYGAPISPLQIGLGVNFHFN
jgi:iron complex outermembrane receptor protein